MIGLGFGVSPHMIDEHQIGWDGQQDDPRERAAAVLPWDRWDPWGRPVEEGLPVCEPDAFPVCTCHGRSDIPCAAHDDPDASCLCPVGTLDPRCPTHDTAVA